MIGRANEVVALVLDRPSLFPELVAGLSDPDPLIRMRAADAMEKATRSYPQLLQPFKRKLLALLAEATQQELRWHLAAMAPRMTLSAAERKRALAALTSYLKDRSSIVKTSALQAMVELTISDRKLFPPIVNLLRKSAQTGTPAMRARARKLLATFKEI